jgi:hypothetical protein
MLQMKQMPQVRVSMHYMGDGAKDDVKTVRKIGSRRVVVRTQGSLTVLSEDGQYWAGTLWAANIGWGIEMKRRSVSVGLL